MTRRFRPLAGAAVLCCAATLAAQEPPKAAEPKPGKEEMKKDEMKAKPGMMKGPGTTKQVPNLADDAAGQDVVYLSSDGPVRVRFAATIDGRPAEAVWRSALDKLFAVCDRGGDGQLDAKERAVFNQPRQAYSLVDQDGNVYTNTTPQVRFQDRAGKVDRDAFRAAFRAAGLGPLQVAVKPTRSKSPEMTDALFKLLDTDKDGKLSAAELKAAAGRLAGLDVNEDELVSSQELLGRGFSDPSGNYFVTTMNAPAGKPATSSDFFFPPADPAQAAKELLKLRDKNKDGKLSPEELGWRAPGLSALDTDGDDRLSEAELAAWLRSPPDLEFRISLGGGEKGWAAEVVEGFASLFRKPGQPPAPLALVPRPGRPSRFADMVRTEADGSVVLRLTDARLRFNAGADTRQQMVAQWNAIAEQVKQQFDAMAGDKKTIDRKQFNEDPNLAQYAGLFDLADRNGDGRLDKKEVEATLTALAPLAGCRAEVSIVDQGRGLFELIDRDGDGKLSPRELTSAHKLIAAYDRDGDGKLVKTEIPKVFPVTTAPASVQVMQMGGYFPDFAVAGGYGGSSAPQAAANAPDWFHKMDRNGDGDVSRREFLGPRELFKQLDADGDGLISAEEARAAEKKGFGLKKKGK